MTEQLPVWVGGAGHLAGQSDPPGRRSRVTLEPVPNRADAAEAAAMLRRLLEAVARGDLLADSAKGRALVRRIEGAALAFELAAGVHL